MGRLFLFGVLFTLVASDASAVALMQCPEFGGTRDCHVVAIYPTATECRAGIDGLVRPYTVSFQGPFAGPDRGIFICYAKPGWPRDR